MSLKNLLTPDTSPLQDAFFPLFTLNWHRVALLLNIQSSWLPISEQDMINKFVLHESLSNWQRMFFVFIISYCIPGFFSVFVLRKLGSNIHFFINIYCQVLVNQWLVESFGWYISLPWQDVHFHSSQEFRAAWNSRKNSKPLQKAIFRLFFQF